MYGRRRNSINKTSNKTQPKNSDNGDSEIFICFCCCAFPSSPLGSNMEFIFDAARSVFFVFFREALKEIECLFYLNNNKFSSQNFFSLASLSPLAGEGKQCSAKKCISQWPCRWKSLFFLTWRPIVEIVLGSFSDFSLGKRVNREVQSHKRFETIISCCLLRTRPVQDHLFCERGERLMRSRHTW